MNKLLCVISSPLDTFSGYGKRSSDFIKALIKIKGEEWDIKLISQRWGDTPFGALDDNNPEDVDLKQRIVHGIEAQPDIWIQITVPNEFQTVGKFNIGISALVETNIVPLELLEGMNKMNLNIVSSEHAKNIAKGTSWDKIDEKTKQKTAQVTLQKPVEVLFEGIDTKIYQNKNVEPLDLSFIKEEFCFLSVGHLLSGVLELEDRKMFGVTIQSFLNAFKNKKIKPALILKASTGGYSHMDEETTMRVIDDFVKKMKGNDLPSIYLIHGELTEAEMNGLYNHPKVKAYINVGNEGYGRPELEFSAATGKPVIASPWGGHVDFLDREFTMMTAGELLQVHPVAANQFLLKEGNWFKPNPISLIGNMKEIYTNYSKHVDNGKRLGYRCKTNFNFEKMCEKLDSILKDHIPKMSVPVPIQLPKIAKLNLVDSK